MSRYGSTMAPRVTPEQRATISSLLWIGAALILTGALFFTTVRFDKVKGTEVGVMLNRLTGKMTVVEQSGVRVYCGVTHKLYTIDRTLQTLEMTEDLNKGDRPGEDDLKFKTVDGSDVYADVKAQYQIIPSMADLVLRSSGLGESYKTKWARDYVRSILRHHLGELKTEEVYNADLREQKVQDARRVVNSFLNKWGISVEAIVLPRKPYFYEEYEAKIKEKKLADQSVLEETSSAAAATQKQQTELQMATNKMNVAVKAYTGEVRQLILAAEGDAEKAMKEADAYYTEKTTLAEATLYSKDKEAQGVLAGKTAEAAGMQKMRDALAGPGGVNMVKLEYAKALAGVSFDAQPFTYQTNPNGVIGNMDMKAMAATTKTATPTPAPVKGN